MGKRLTQNLNSAYIEAANRLRPSRTRRRIVAYVESFDDVAFWRSILDDYEDDTRYFEIKLPSRKNLGKGKRQVLLNLFHADQLGGAMIACVDADYDYLLQDVNEESRFISQSPYSSASTAKSSGRCSCGIFGATAMTNTSSSP